MRSFGVSLGPRLSIFSNGRPSRRRQKKVAPQGERKIFL